MKLIERTAGNEEIILDSSFTHSVGTIDGELDNLCLVFDQTHTRKGTIVPTRTIVKFTKEDVIKLRELLNIKSIRTALGLND